MRNLTYAVLAGICLSTLVSFAQSTGSPMKDPELTGSITTGFSSVHIYRGVDSALDDSIVWASLTLSYEGFTAGTWYGTGPTSDYEEVDFFGSYTWASELADFSVGFLFYHFPENKDLDSTDFYVRASRGFEVGDNTTLSPYLTLVYNESAEGFYLEGGASLATQLSERVGLVATAWLAASDDFRSDDGLDNATFHLSLPIAITQSAVLSPYAGVSTDLEAIESISEDEGWVGVSFQVTF